MDIKFLRMLIFALSGLIAVFALLILINYAGSLSGSRPDLPGEEEAGGKLPVAEALARQYMAAARYSGGASASMIPASRQGLSTSAVNSQGAIMLVKDKDFGGVAETPKDMLGILSELGGGDKRKPAPIALKESDLDKKIISLGSVPAGGPRLKASSMPEMGRGAGQEGVTLLSAPVDYKIFKSPETWRAFANSRKCRSTLETAQGFKPLSSPLSGPDFSRESVVVLVSMSELPNGIFKIVKVERDGRELRLDYRVDPLAMAVGETGRHDFYSAAVIPKGPALKLRQVP